MRSIVFLPLLFLLSRSQVITPNGCFEAIRNCGVAGVGAPYLTVAAATQADCLALCQADTRCVGVRFGVSFNGGGVCRLYNTLPGTRYPYVPYYRPYGGGFGGGQFGGQFGGRGGGGQFGGPYNGFNSGRYNGGYNGGRGGYNVYNGGGGYYNDRDRGRYGDGDGRYRGRGNHGSGFFRSLEKEQNLGDPANDTVISKFLRKSSKVDGKVVKGDGGEMIFPEAAPPLKGSALSEADIRQVVENAKKEGKPPSMNHALSRHFSQQPYFYYSRGSGLFRWTGRCPRGGLTVGPVLTAAPDTIAPTVATVATFATTVRLRPSTPVTPAPTPPLPARVQCPAGKVAKYLKLENTEQVGLDDFTFTAASVDQCIAACTNNALPDGSQAACLSFDYDRATSVCALSLEALPPAGTGARAEAPGKDYYEKVCLDATLVEGCTDVLETIPNTILVGFARGVTTESSYANCIQTCLNSQQLFGFKCVSGQFFAEAADQNCVLNEESKNTQPGLLNVLDNEAVTYFDFDCQLRRSPLGEPMKLGHAGNILQPGREFWGPWSYCNKKSNMVTRFRNCLTYNPRSCENESVSCDKKT